MIRRYLPLIIALALLTRPLMLEAMDEPTSPREALAGSPILAPTDRAHYQEIFRLQEAGRWEEADKEIAQFSNRLLMGHVLAQRYLHPTAYRSRFRELNRWLDFYPDHPEAQQIYRLARKRKPSGSRPLTKPTEKPNSLSERLPPPPAYRSELRLSQSKYRFKVKVQRKIRRYLRKTYLSKTERLLHDKKVRQVLDHYEFDQAYAELAAAWLYYGEAEKALRLASEVSQRSGIEIPIAHWTAGLAAWKLGQFRNAAQHFAKLASSEDAPGWNRAAAAYWAARAYFKEINLAEAERWLNRASQFRETFYGLLALRRLGSDPGFSFEIQVPQISALADLRAYPEVRRAIALLEIGDRTRAEQELLWLEQWHDPGMPEELAALANDARLPQLSLRLATRLLDAGATRRVSVPMQAISYPLAPWRPRSGFKVDQALLLEFIRQESSFDPSAKSPDGARGLMQLMPRTASALSRAAGIPFKGKKALYDSELNLELAQAYLLRLLDSSRVRNDLLRLAAAYNAGPGNLAAWDHNMGQPTDPLLFLETLPSRETRLFVERVMTNLWVYRFRLGQAAPSLDALAAGRWPQYSPQDPAEGQLVSAAPEPPG